MKFSWQKIIALFLTATVGAVVPASAVTDREEWSGSYFMGQKLGFNHARVEVGPKSIRVNTQVFFRLEAGGAVQKTSITQETELTHDLQLIRFSLLQELMGKRQKIEGRVAGDQLIYEVTTRGFYKKKTLPFPPGTVPASTVWLNILERGLKVGRQGSFNLFIESFQTFAPMSYRVLRKEAFSFEGKQVETFVVQQEYAGFQTTLWVAPDGSVLREVSVQGFESRKEPEAKARDMGPHALSVSSFITLSLVEIDRPITNSFHQDRLKIEVSRLAQVDSVPQDHRQTVLKTVKTKQGTFTTTLVVQREVNRPARSALLPLQLAENPSLLEETSQIQSRHPMIRALMREVVASETDAWRAALKINHWVYQNMEKVLVDAFTALDALHDRKGECQSHTNLFTAIARAAGIPTKVVNGLVYSNEFKGFVYHAWPEVWVGEWRALDPTFGQDRVDATHIKLSEGNNEGALKLTEFIGIVGIKIIEK